MPSAPARMTFPGLARSVGSTVFSMYLWSCWGGRLSTNSRLSELNMINPTSPTPNFLYGIWTDTFRISMETTEEQYLSGDDSQFGNECATTDCDGPRDKMDVKVAEVERGRHIMSNLLVAWRSLLCRWRFGLPQIRLNTFLIRMSCHGTVWAILKIQSSLDLGHYVSNVRQL